MGQEFMARADVARGIAKYIKKSSEETLYDYANMSTYVSNNSFEGKIQPSLFKINQEMDTSIACSKQLMAWTANFVSTAADIFEETDRNAAKEITES